MTVAQAYSRGVTGDTAIDTVRRAITQVQLMRGWPTGIVCGPDSLERLELKKDAEGNYILALEVDAANRAVLWRLPFITNDALGSNVFLVGDFARGSHLYDRQQATVELSTEDRDNFIRNLVTIRAESRLALAITRPSLFVKGTLA